MITLNDILWTNEEEADISEQAGISVQSNIMTIEMCCWNDSITGTCSGWPSCGEM